ncbi:MAG: trypsin-like peptidase domain-containing protein [Acidimicrobiales bacterium]
MRFVFAAVAVVALLGCQADATSDVFESGVGIVVEGCAGLATDIGSGMTVERSGQVVTTAHVVAGASSITVIDPLGNEFPATINALDGDADLALLDVPGLATPPLKVGEARVDDATAVVWAPDEGVRLVPVMVTKLISITIEDIYVEHEVHRSGLELVGDISVGDSGGAVVDDAGEIVGIIYARSRQRDETAFATDHNELLRLLRERPLDATDRCQ